MEKVFAITGMTCAACSAGIQKTVGKMKGVRKAEVSLMGEKMQVEFDETVLSSQEIVAAVESLGYGASVRSEGTDAKVQKIVSAPLPEDAAQKLKHRFFASLCF